MGASGETGHYYYMSECQQTWQAAQAAATELLGYLITLESGDDYFISDVLQNYAYEDFWIGLSDQDNDGFYQWENDEHWPISRSLINDHPYVAVNNSGFWYYWFTFPEEQTLRYIIEFKGAQSPNCLATGWTHVCHNGQTICVTNQAVQAHLDHGDYLGPCYGCNSPENLTAARHEGSVIEESSFAERTHAHDEVEGHHQPDQGSIPELKIYPNPTTGHVLVGLPVHIDDCMLHVRTITGQEIESMSGLDDKHITLDMSRYASGIYLIVMQSEANHWQQKLIEL